MTDIYTKFGPGPTPIANEWLNSLQQELIDRQKVLGTFGSGVVIGLEVAFDVLEAGDKLSITMFPGEAMVEGAHHIVEDDRQFVFDQTGAGRLNSEGLVIVYLNEDGVVTIRNREVGGGITEAWPLLCNDREPRALPLLAVAKVADDGQGWAWYRDVRRFVREKPIADYWVVGDLAAGADFDTIPKALNYLEACEKGGNPVPRKILVTEDQDLGDGHVDIEIDDIVIEGTEASGKERRVVISWDGTFSAFWLNRNRNVTISNFRFEPRDNAWRAVWNPGDNFTMSNCEYIGESGTGTLRALVGVMRGREDPLIGLHLVRNRAIGLRYGIVDNTDVLQQALIRENTIDCRRVAINAGGDASARNTISHNTILNCLDGIKIGKNSTVVKNTIEQCRNNGIRISGDQTVVRENEIRLNNEYISEHRAGIVVSAPLCHINNNTVLVIGNWGNGIVQGPARIQNKHAIDAYVHDITNVGRLEVTGNFVAMQFDNQNNASLQTRGFGIAMMSSSNRITENTVKGVAVGIFAGVSNTIGDNKIINSTVGIMALKNNQISANSVDWCPLDGWENIINTVPPFFSYYRAGILVSMDNVVANNSVVEKSLFFDTGPRTGIQATDWPKNVLGHAGVEDGGNNIISNCRVELQTEDQFVTGVTVGRIQFDSNDEHVNLFPKVKNTVTGVQVRNGFSGIEAVNCATVVDGCSVVESLNNCIHLIYAENSKISGCHLITLLQNNELIKVGPGCHGASINDCYLEKTADASPVHETHRVELVVQMDSCYVDPFNVTLKKGDIINVYFDRLPYLDLEEDEETSEEDDETTDEGDDGSESGEDSADDESEAEDEFMEGDDMDWGDNDDIYNFEVLEPIVLDERNPNFRVVVTPISDIPPIPFSFSIYEGIPWVEISPVGIPEADNEDVLDIEIRRVVSVTVNEVEDLSMPISPCINIAYTEKDNNKNITVADCTIINKTNVGIFCGADFSKISGCHFETYSQHPYDRHYPAIHFKERIVPGGALIVPEYLPGPLGEMIKKGLDLEVWAPYKTARYAYHFNYAPGHPSEYLNDFVFVEYDEDCLEQFTWDEVREGEAFGHEYFVINNDIYEDAAGFHAPAMQTLSNSGRQFYSLRDSDWNKNGAYTRETRLKNWKTGIDYDNMQNDPRRRYLDVFVTRDGKLKKARYKANWAKRRGIVYNVYQVLRPLSPSQGNLVWGCHMYHSQEYNRSTGKSPIWWLNERILTKEESEGVGTAKYDPESGRHDSIVHLDSCYYRDESTKSDG